MNKQKLIDHLSLSLHPLEGGYFRRTYESALSTDTNNGKRKLLTSIYYMLSDDSPIGYLHKNKSDIIHYYHLGSPMEYVVVENGELVTRVLGPNIEQGHVLQLTVSANCWKGSRLLNGGFSLISEAVAPGFDYEDNKLARASDIKELSEAAKETLAAFLKAND